MRSPITRAFAAWRRVSEPDPPTSDDWSLWQRATQGDADSAQQLVRALMPQALGLARQMLGSGDAAADAVQDAFLRLWRSRARDTGQARLSTYFNTIVLNRCRSALTAAQRERSTDPDELALMQEHRQTLLPTPSGTPETARRLREAIDALPARQRMAIAMWTYADADVAEIAQALAIDPNAAHQLLHRAKRKLRDVLQAAASTGAELP